MRRLAIALHLNQSPLAHEEVLRATASKCYLPLIKLIKEKKYKVTLNIPLSLLELMDKYGYQGWLADLQELVKAERVELTGGAAYGALLTQIPPKFAEKQIILNEYGLGYYFGKKGGFEGDPSILIRDLRGFLLPKLAVSAGLIDLLEELGYEWVLANSDFSSGVYGLKGKDIKVVIPNKVLGNLIKSKTDLKVDSLVSEFLKEDASIVCLPGETFGILNEQGVLLFEHIMDSFREKGIETSFVTEFVEFENHSGFKEVEEIVGKGSNEQVYDKSNSQNEEIAKLYQEILNTLFDTYEPMWQSTPFLGAEEVAFWKESDLQKIEDEKVRNSVKADLLFNKILSSDAFGNVKLVEEFLAALQNEKLSQELMPKLINLSNKNPTV